MLPTIVRGGGDERIILSLQGGGDNGIIPKGERKKDGFPFSWE